MKRLRINRSRTYFIGLASALGFILSIGTLTVFAAFGLTNDLPSNNENYQSAGVNGAIDLHLKDLDVAQVTKNKFAAYYPSSINSANDKSITISKGKSPNRVCNIDADVTGHIYVKITINGVSTPDSGQYNIPIQSVCSGNQFFGHTFDFPNGGLIPNSGTNHNKADIEISMIGTTTKNANEGLDLNYQVSLSGGDAGQGTLALKENRFEKQFGLRSTYTANPQPNKEVRVTLPFGYKCDIDVSNPRERVVKLYDADSVFGDTYMWVTRDGARLDHDDYENFNNPFVSPDPRSDGGRRNIVGMNNDEFIANNNRWKLQGSNNDYNQLTIKQSAIIKGHDYELVIVNNGAGGSLSPHYNTLSVAIPQDGIYSTLGEGSNDPCKYSLRPTVSVDPNLFVYYPELRVDASIQKTDLGPVTENHTWELLAVRYQGEPSTRDLTNSKVGDGTNPCDVLPSGYLSGTCMSVRTLTYPGQASTEVDPYNTGGPYAVGTRLCFFARIQNPTYLEDDNDQWHYSDLDCSISAKKPRAQFRGSDLRVTGNISSGSYLVQGTNFGSWAEYGMFLSGVNSMAASGGALKNGSTASVDAWNQLTFANRDSVGNPSYGYFGLLPGASSAYGYFTGLPRSADSLNAATIPNGVYNVGGSVGNTLARLPEAKGGGVVLIRDGNFTISDNIIVDNAGRTSAREITQVVIVANNIMIDEDVTRVDAWLVTPSTGSITTCPVAFSNLNAGECNQKLTVNGAIHTGKLYLRRTAGANPPGADQLKEPAEVFNLRPDAQLWAYTYANKADYAQTDYIQELPPRY
ncbi:MAG: hypothetical protein QG649_413 [Patescibacteria group bacterium]|nr:hypothetical protein [Patescibacteria group bacterium]